MIYIDYIYNFARTLNFNYHTRTHAIPFPFSLPFPLITPHTPISTPYQPSNRLARSTAENFNYQVWSGRVAGVAGLLLVVSGSRSAVICCYYILMLLHSCSDCLVVLLLWLLPVVSGSGTAFVIYCCSLMLLFSL